MLVFEDGSVCFLLATICSLQCRQSGRPGGLLLYRPRFRGTWGQPASLPASSCSFLSLPVLKSPMNNTFLHPSPSLYDTLSFEVALEACVCVCVLSSLRVYSIHIHLQVALGFKAPEIFFFTFSHLFTSRGQRLTCCHQTVTQLVGFCLRTKSWWTTVIVGTFNLLRTSIARNHWQ